MRYTLPEAVLGQSIGEGIGTPGTNTLVMEFTGVHMNSYRSGRKRAAERITQEAVQEENEAKRQVKQRMEQQTKRANVREQIENGKKKKKEMEEEKEQKAGQHLPHESIKESAHTTVKKS